MLFKPAIHMLFEIDDDAAANAVSAAAAAASTVVTVFFNFHMSSYYLYT